MAVEVSRRPGEVANEEVYDARDCVAGTVAERLDELSGRHDVPGFAAGRSVYSEGSVQLESLKTVVHPHTERLARGDDTDVSL